MKIENIKNFGIHRWPEGDAVSEWVVTEDGRLFMRAYLVGATVSERVKNSNKAKWKQIRLEVEDEQEKDIRDGGPGINIKRPAR